MKKIKSLILLCVLAVMSTGCVKFNANIDIKKDKSMDFSILYAVNTSLLGDQASLEDADISEIEKQGFHVEKYSENNMEGFTISKKVNNIDLISSTEDTEYDLSGMLQNDSEKNYIFKVKKGLLKNTYTAKFKFDASDSDLSDIEEEYNADDDLSWDSEEDDTNFDTSSLSDFDISSMMSNLDLSFNVSLPYSAKSNNATSTENDNKKLSWSFMSSGQNTAEFEFELYNIENIFLIGGAIIIVLIIAIILFMKRKKSNKNKNMEPMITPVNNSPESSSQTIDMANHDVNLNSSQQENNINIQNN